LSIAAHQQSFADPDSSQWETAKARDQLHSSSYGICHLPFAEVEEPAQEIHVEATTPQAHIPLLGRPGR
jgi:hypothetical protein